jgi:rare lipoprotein A
MSANRRLSRVELSQQIVLWHGASGGIAGWPVAFTLFALLTWSGGCRRATEQQAEVGIASWYGHPFHGRPTASGEIFDMEAALTAAHRTLPLGAIVEITNLSNTRKFQVRVNDRGPFVANRIVDLSHGSAKQIEMPGIADVRLIVIRLPRTRGPDLFAVQVAQLSDRLDSEKLREAMEARFGVSQLVYREGDHTWRVLVGIENSEENAGRLAERIGAVRGGTFVVRIDSEESNEDRESVFVRRAHFERSVRGCAASGDRLRRPR